MNATDNATNATNVPTLSEKEIARRARVVARFKATQETMGSLMRSTDGAKGMLSESVRDTLDSKGLTGRDRAKERARLVRADKAALAQSVDVSTLQAVIRNGRIGLTGLAEGKRGDAAVTVYVDARGTVRENVTVNVNALVNVLGASAVEKLTK